MDIEIDNISERERRAAACGADGGTDTDCGAGGARGRRRRRYATSKQRGARRADTPRLTATTV